MKLRLHKFIANCGYTSRRHAELLIGAGRVAVDGRVVDQAGVSIDPARSVVTINGEELRLPEPTTIAFHKPPGLITSTHDTHERLTVMDYLPRSIVDLGVLPAGRLDQDTEGLLVLTNVGDLNHRITHPRYGTEKEYIATLERRPDAKALARLESGVMIDGEKTSPARVSSVRETAAGCDVGLILREGRKRQVRRMFSAVGHEVMRLRRVRIGELELGHLELELGGWRRLDADDIARLTGPTEHSADPPERGCGSRPPKRPRTGRSP